MKTLFSLLLLAVWLILGSWFYTCKVKGLCTDGFINFTKKEVNLSNTKHKSDDVTAIVDSTDTNQKEASDSLEIMKSKMMEGKEATKSQTSSNPVLSNTRKLKVGDSPNVTFGYASTAVNARSSLIRYIQEIKQHLEDNADHSVEIIGHTDSFEDGDFRGNLGLERARAVQKIMIDNSIEESKTSIRSMRSKKPVADNSLIHGRELNRRVEINVIK